VLELAICIIFLGLLFDYTNGFHDASVVLSTIIATRALIPAVAIGLTALLNTVGATQISGVVHTISSGLVEPNSATECTVIFALIGAIIWNCLTWYFGLPSSSSYALIGGLIGAAWVEGGMSTIIWSGLIYKVLIPMVVSPFLGFALAFIVMQAIYRCTGGRPTAKTERVFRYVQIGSGSLMALSHGLNDAQKSMGIITLGLFAAGMVTSTQTPLWVILACALVMGLGTAFGGLRIIRTVGFKITHISPAQGVAAEASAALIILSASALGMPVSSSQMIVGSVGGVGVAKGVRYVRWRVGRQIGLAWLLTFPGAAIISAFCSMLHKLI
jgi:PiT family inorganic phosphate transporter